MFLFIVIIAIVAYVLWKRNHYNDSDWVKERIKGRSEEQKAVIRYFGNSPSCLSKSPISDEEYDAMLLAELERNNSKEKALDRIGLDEDQVKEIDPVHFGGFLFDKDSLSKQGKDGKYRSSKYQITWLFFSSSQVFLYQNTFNMDEDGRMETVEEYFYKDITNFSASNDIVETSFYDEGSKMYQKKNIQRNRFALVVPGDKFYCSMEQNDYTENAIRGMRAMLREKKG
jgi:hypothetical protein